MQYSLFDNAPSGATHPNICLADLFEAYECCRKNKRNTTNALAFELDYEKNLVTLRDEINRGTYNPGSSIAFIVDKPVKREIFAADFRDRVVHHWLVMKLNPLFENVFINDSYACRTGKGTHFGIKQVDSFIKNCSNNYKNDCYILKLDIAGFFMHINRNILFDKLHSFILNNYQASDKQLIIDICKKMVHNNPAKSCIIKGSRADWIGLPNNKSLFHSPDNCGLPIGNLTSQVFANFYMNPFDWFVKNDLGIIFYGRYVDDFVIIHNNIDYLKSLIPRIRYFLQNELHLQLHPKKIYLQHYSKGVRFLGTVIKPDRIYIANRTKGNFYSAIKRQNAVVKEKKPDKEAKLAFLSSMNSYLGIMKHYNTYSLRKRMIFKNLSAWWLNHAFLSGGIAKFVLKKKITLNNSKAICNKGFSGNSIILSRSNCGAGEKERNP